MPAGDAFWLCHECRAEMRPIERGGVLTCASCGGEFIEIANEDVNPDPFAELPHPPTRPGQAPRHASPDPDDNPDFFSSMFNRLLGAQPGQQTGPPGRSGGGSSSNAIRDLGSPAAMHGQRPPEGGQGRSYEFTVPGGGSGRIVIGGFGGGGSGGRGGGGFMLGGGSGAGGTGQNANPFFPGFPPPPNPYRSNHQHTHTHTHTHNDLTPMPEDQLLQALMEMIASENDMAPQMLFGGMPGFGATRGGASSFGDYATTEHGFNEILERLMHAAGPQGPIPATDAVIDNLPRSSFDDKSLAASVYKDCPVCKDDFAVGDEHIRIPCAHIFHPDCLTPWLKQNGSCPVCRYSLVSDGNGPTAANNSAAATNPPSSSSAGTRPPQPSAAQGQTAQTTDDQPESFFTSILNRLWGPSGEARSPTTETFPGMASQADETAVPRFPGAMPRDSAEADRGSGSAIRHGEALPPFASASDASSGVTQEREQEQEPQSLYAGFQARTRSFNSTPSESLSRTPAPASGQTNGAHADPPDPVLRNVSSAIPDDYRARHRQREQEAERERERERERDTRNLPHDDLD